MTMAVSIGTMVKQVAGLLGTKDLTPWEAGFVSNVSDRTENGKDTTKLSEKQVEIVEKIWGRNFA